MESISIRNNTLIYILNKKKKVTKHIMNFLVRVKVVAEKNKKVKILKKGLNYFLLLMAFKITVTITTIAIAIAIIGMSKVGKLPDVASERVPRA